MWLRGFSLYHLSHSAEVWKDSYAQSDVNAVCQSYSEGLHESVRICMNVVGLQHLDKGKLHLDEEKPHLDAENDPFLTFEPMLHAA